MLSTNKITLIKNGLALSNTKQFYIRVANDQLYAYVEVINRDGEKSDYLLSRVFIENERTIFDLKDIEIITSTSASENVFDIRAFKKPD